MKTTTLQSALLPIFMTIALCSCSQRNAAPGGAAASAPTLQNAPSQSASSTGADPCSLLEPSEVEAIMGPLAGKPYRTKSGMSLIAPVPDGDTCVYETPDFRAILVTVEWQDGGQAFGMMNLPGRLASGVMQNAPKPTADAAKSMLPGGVQIDGEWDEATSTGCCEIYALRGDQLITYDYRGWRADTARAVVLLNKALLRLEHPLSIDGNAGNEAAKLRAEGRPKPQSVCALLSRAEVEAILGPLAADPKPSDKDETQGCIYRFTQAEAKGSLLADTPEQFKSMLGALTGGRTGMVAGQVDTGIEIRWRTGFRLLSDSEIVGNAVMTNVSDYQAGLPKRTLGRVSTGTLGRSGANRLEFHRRQKGCRRHRRYRADARARTGGTPSPPRGQGHRKVADQELSASDDGHVVVRSDTPSRTRLFRDTFAFRAGNMPH